MSAQKGKIIVDFLKTSSSQAKIVGQKAGLAVRTSANNVAYPGKLFYSLVASQAKSSNSKNSRNGSRLKLAEAEDDKVHEEGMKLALKELAKEQESHEKKLDDLVEKSEKVLAKFRNIIPIFTDELVIDPNMVTIVNRPFFFSEHIQSISIKNINDVFIQTAPFLATIIISDVGLPKSHLIRIKWLWKRDAEKARRIITGLMTAAKENIDVKNLDENRLEERLEELGKVRGARTTVSGA